MSKLVLLFFTCMKYLRNKWVKIIAVLLIAMSAMALMFAETDKEFLTACFIDIEHGDSILIQADQESLLIDAGLRENVPKVLSTLHSEGIQEITWLLITHEHEDHIGGVPEILKKIPVRHIVHAVRRPEEIMQEVLEIAHEKNIDVIEVYKGDRFPLGNATVRILGPFDDEGDENNRSVICRIIHGDISFLFMGDAEIEEEQDLLASDYEIDSDVLKVGHHGADTSTCRDLIDAVTPQIAVISAAADAAADAPELSTDVVVQRLQEAKMDVYQTSADGDIEIRSDGKNLYLNKQGKKDE